MAAYSALFSAGLLAPSHAYNNSSTPRTPSNTKGSATLFPASYGDSSPIRPVSPLPMADDSDVELDSRSDTDDMDVDRRESTPTQQSISTSAAAKSELSKFTALNRGASATLAASPALPTAASKVQPRLRKRRSSLTTCTSPLNAIRSPARTAGAALQLQRHLAMSSGSRSRSGSVNGPPSVDAFGMFGSIGLGVASEGTSLMGRLRSGSVGSNVNNALTSAMPGRMRRHVRRITSVPAPSAPPPTAPLPALPSCPPTMMYFRGPASRAPLAFQNNDLKNAPPTAFNAPAKGFMPTRERGLSVSGTVGRIDEELKEN